MIHIAVCDDELEIVERLAGIIEEYFIMLRRSSSVKVHRLTDGNEVIKHLSELSLIFLDIEMEPVDGISLAKQIRRVRMDVPIVYVTGYPDYWRSAYEVHTFDFVEKPIAADRIIGILDDFIRHMEEKAGARVKLECGSQTLLQKMNDIYYFELIQKKQVRLKTTNGEYIVRENLSEILDKLNSLQFVLVHRAYIVNIKCIMSIGEKDIFLDNGDMLPISRKGRKVILEMINEGYTK